MTKKLTTDEFIERAKRIHGDKYDYSKVDYKGSKEKVCIICPEHGEFLQIPSAHLMGNGCKKCANEKLYNERHKNNEQFIKDSKKIHGNKYDYSKVNYVNSFTKVCIICPEHGEFWQTPANHLSGKGCIICGRNSSDSKKRSNKSEFIEKAKEVHNNRYEYSKVEYINALTKVCIICPEHGEFMQTPNTHLDGHGCPKCGINRAAAQKTMSTEEFIERAKTVHGNKYNYSKTKYKNTNEKVTIICPKHGEFKQTPSIHLNGCGCPKCAGNIKLSTEEFIEKAHKVHGDKYNYSKVEYINTGTKVCIICPEHGEFWQEPENHLQGEKCPMCSETKLEKEIRILLEKNKINFIYDKSNDWLKGLRLDFYLPEYNAAIECQGLQHFEPVDFAGKGEEWAKQKFIENIKRDKRKKKLCEENNVKLIYYVGKNKNNILKEIKNEII